MSRSHAASRLFRAFCHVGVNRFIFATLVSPLFRSFSPLPMFCRPEFISRRCLFFFNIFFIATRSIAEIISRYAIYAAQAQQRHAVPRESTTLIPRADSEERIALQTTPAAAFIARSKRREMSSASASSRTVSRGAQLPRMPHIRAMSYTTIISIDGFSASHAFSR